MPHQSSSSTAAEDTEKPEETCLKAAFRGRLMLSRDFPLPEGYTGLVLRVDAPKLSSTVLQQRPTAPLKRKQPLSTLPPDPKRRRTSPRKAKMLARARPKFSMDSDEEADEQDEHEPQPTVDSAQSSQTLIEDPVPEQEEQEEPVQEPEQEEEGVKDAAVQLKPLGKFEEMRIWSADAELDEGQDAIVRSMREWYSMAELVSLLFFSVCLRVGLTMRLQIHS